MNAPALPLSPLDPVAVRRRSAAVAALLLVAAASLIVVEETWLRRARSAAGSGVALGRALSISVDFPSALAAAVGVFALLEVLRATITLARSGQAAGLRALTPPIRAVRWLLLAALSASLASAPGSYPRGLAAILGLCVAAWLRTLKAGPGVTLVCAPCVLPATSVVAPLHTAMPALLVVAGLALFFDGCARRRPLLACASGALLVAGMVFVTGRSRLTRVEWDREMEGVAALCALALVAIAYGVRALRARSRR